MSYIKKLNKKLIKLFDADVEAREENGLLILSGTVKTHQDVVYAGTLSLNTKRYRGLVNDIRCTDERATPPRMPADKDTTLSSETPDVLIIGGGIVGCAIARELTRHNLDVILVEKEPDLAMQASGRNDGLVHAGIDLRQDSRKFFYNRAGNRIFGDICAELGVHFERPGQFICFDNPLWIPILYLSLIYWSWIGLRNVKVLGKGKLRELEPSVRSDLCAALYFPSTGIVSPYNLTIAYAENAVQNGAKVFLDTAVTGMEVEDGLIKVVKTNRGKIRPRLVINAAGVFCEDISKMAEDRFYSIHPRKGTSAVLDKKYTDAIIRTAISSFGTAATKKAHTKGGGIFKTTYGNALVGPDAIETIEKEDFTTHRNSIIGTLQRQGQTVPGLSEDKIITYFSGIRACTYEEDFVVEKGRFTKNIIHAAGIQSPGLTAAPAIGQDVANIAVKLLGGEAVVEKRATFNPKRDAPPCLSKLDLEARAQLIRENPDYGIIICRCEEVSKGEILDALRRNIPCYTLDGIKRRVRPGMGRCQGSFCGPLVLDIIAGEKGLSYSDVKKSGSKADVLLGAVKQKYMEGRK